MSLLTRWRGHVASRTVLLAAARTRLAHAERGLAWARKAKRPTVHQREADVSALRQLVKTREGQLSYARRVVQRHTPLPLRERAFHEAVTQVGIMESGGNNAGIPLVRYERPNGATGPESWCGDFQAWCYRMAGSKAVTRSWAAVRLLGAVVGVKATKDPEQGDLVRYDFPGEPLGHVGMFDCFCNAAGGQVPRAQATHIRTIEGNTGSVGAVSDSKTGGDGVYRKVRDLALVHDFLRVTK
jgi:hypothetical protein